MDTDTRKQSEPTTARLKPTDASNEQLLYCTTTTITINNELPSSLNNNANKQQQLVNKKHGEQFLRAFKQLFINETHKHGEKFAKQLIKSNSRDHKNRGRV